MAINLPGVPFKLTAQDMGGLGGADLAGSLQSGFDAFNKFQEARYKPKNMAEQLLAQQLQNKIQGVNAQYAEPMKQLQMQQQQSNLSMNPLRMKLLEAQAQRQQQLANQPFGGQLTGTAKEAYALDLMRQQLGEDNPAYQNAKHAYDLSLKSQEGLNQYRQSLMGTANKRAATQLGKLDQEQLEVEKGVMPGTSGQVQLSPDQQQEMLGQYQLQRQKLTTDAQSRQKTLLSSNIDKTIKEIDPKSLSQYAGTGEIKKKFEEIRAPFGKESKQYRDYTNNLSKVKLLAHQVRQFYGDSIQPAMTQAIERMVNPATWANNPEIARNNYNAVIDILKKETGTYSGSLKNVGEYRPKNESASSNKELTYNTQTGRLE